MVGMLVFVVLLIMTLIGVCFFYLRYQKMALREEFQGLSAAALEKAQKDFLQLAAQVLEKQKTETEIDIEEQKKEYHHLIDPMKELLLRLDAQNRDIERKREGAYGSLEKQIEQLIRSEKELRMEAANLAGALKSPTIRGSWGQVHLRRVVELSGMRDQCDFFEQVDVRKEGKIYRPDLVVKLPGKREIVVDAKVSLEAYLHASNTENEEEKKRYLLEHTEQIKRHIKSLSAKEYWKQFSSSPEYVILFLPAEAFFSAALRCDPSIIETGIDRNVIVATPTTLIAILKAASLGWRQENLSKESEKIAHLGKELYDRILTMIEQWNKVGRSHSQSVNAYDQATASLKSRVFPAAKRLKNSVSDKEIGEIPYIEKTAKQIQPAEFSSKS